MNLLVIFFAQPQERFYLRELQRLSKIPLASLQRHLARLEKCGLLKATKEYRLKFFSINPDYPYYSEMESIILREDRKKRLKATLKKIVKLIKTNYQPDKIILYGSLASGTVALDSDIDLMIIKNGVPARYWERVKEIAWLFKECEVGVDFVIWTPEEMATEMGKNIFLRTEILEKGKTIYERAA